MVAGASGRGQLDPVFKGGGTYCRFRGRSAPQRLFRSRLPPLAVPGEGCWEGCINMAADAEGEAAAGAGSGGLALLGAVPGAPCCPHGEQRSGGMEERGRPGALRAARGVAAAPGEAREA